MTDNQRILVTGGTGNLGRAVVQALLEKQLDVVVGTTNPSMVGEVSGIKTTKVVFEDATSMDDALPGISGLFLMAPPMDPEAALKLNPVIDKAKRQGVGHIILNSALGVDMSEEAPLNAVEKHLKASGVNYTILRPNFFMENFSTGFIAPMIQQGGIFLAADNAKTSFISTKDIAQTAAIAFQQKHYGKEYNLTGPDALDHTQVAAMISEVAGKQVQYHSLGENEMLQGARDNGMPEGAVQFLGVLYAGVRSGFFAAVTDDVKMVTGKAPISFGTFVQENKGAWS